MKIPKIPQTPAELVSQVDSINKRISTLSAKEQILRSRRTKTAQTRSVAYVKYRESGLHQDRAAFETTTLADSQTIEELNAIVGELQTLHLRKRYLERLASKNGIVLKVEITTKEKEEQSGGTFGA